MDRNLKRVADPPTEPRTRKECHLKREEKKNVTNPSGGGEHQVARDQEAAASSHPAIISLYTYTKPI